MDFISVNVVDGEILFITKVSRLHMAVYLCIASNGVPPSISKRVQLKVQCKTKQTVQMQVELIILFSSSDAFDSQSIGGRLYRSRCYFGMSYRSISYLHQLLDHRTW